jgi:nicotinamidase-related amidase
MTRNWLRFERIHIALPPLHAPRRIAGRCLQPMPATLKPVLLLVDFMNPLDFDGARELAPKAIAAAKKALALKRRCRAEHISVIYANDNFGHWASQFSEVVRSCVERGGDAAELAALLAPEPGDLSVLKPRHSAFYGTPLEFLLDELRAGCLIITGLTTDSCVLFTAGDAFLRGYRVWVPADCVAAKSAAAQRRALEQVASVAKVWTGPSTTPIRTGVARAAKLHDR